MNSPLDLATILCIPKLPLYLNQVERTLDDVLDSDNAFIRGPILRLIKARGKRLRPALVLAAAISQGAEVDQSVIAGCVAIELVHIASLVHDDIIDHANTRWNVPTINSKEGPNHAIVVGDYLLGKAGMQAATVSSDTAWVVSSAITALCDGQSRELIDQHNPNRTVEALLSATHGKTAALISAACQVGGLCAGLKLTNTQVNAFGRYGEGFGMAFQLVDDMLDYIAEPQLFGKPIGNDIKEGNYTLPLILTLHGDQSRSAHSWISAQSDTPKSVIADTLMQNGSIQQTIIRVQQYNQSAVRALEGLASRHDMRGLSNLPDSYLEWAIANLAAEEYRAKLLTFLGP